MSAKPTGTSRKGPSSESPWDVGFFSVSWVWVLPVSCLAPRCRTSLATWSVQDWEVCCHSGTTSAFTRSPDRSRSSHALSIDLRSADLSTGPGHTRSSDLESMPRTTFVKDFHCVTGWSVPTVHWEGVRLSEILDDVGVQKAAVALSFESYDGADTESLTLDQARLPDVIVAYRMLGAPVTTEHGGPVRLYVASHVRLQVAQVAVGHHRCGQVIPGSGSKTAIPSTVGSTDRPVRPIRL